MAMIIKQLSSLAKVLPGKEPDDSYLITDLSALRGETVSFQVAYYWDQETREYAKIKLNSELSDYITVREVKNVPCEFPSHIDRDDDYISFEPGLYPDLLTKVKDIGADVVAGQWRSIWIDLNVPKEGTAGSYSIEIELYNENQIFGKTQISVEVIDALLPKLCIPHTQWFHTDCIANYYHVEVFSEEYWKIVSNFVRAAVKRQINMILTPIFTPPLDTAVGGERRTVQLVQVSRQNQQYTFDFSLLEKWILMCKSCGVEYFEISHLFSQWGAVAAPKIMATVDGIYKQLFGWDTKADGEEYGMFLEAFLPRLTDFLSNYVKKDQVFFHISDEPSLEQAESYGAALQRVQKYLKGYRIIDALSNYEFYEKGLVEIPVCATNFIKPFLEKRPKELWSYYCTAQYKDVANRFIAMPSYRNRIYGFQLYKYQINGILHWGFNFYNSVYSLYAVNPYVTTGADGAFPSGDPFLVYPGADGKPEESLRIMVLDEALADYRALKYLETLVGREEVLKVLDTERLTFDEYPRNPKYITSVRQKVNQMIKEIAVR